MKATVLSADEFRVIDAEEEYALKETVLLLVRNLAFVSFQRQSNLGIKIEKEQHGKMCAAVKDHEAYFKKQESGGLSYTVLLFHLSYLADILTTMATTESFADKMKLKSAVGEVATDCLALNFSGAIKHLGKSVGNGILLLAKERIRGKAAETNIDYLVKHRAVARLAQTQGGGKGYGQRDSSSSSSSPEYFEAFCDILTHAYNHQLNWKIYIQILYDLRDLVVSLDDPEKRMRLVRGDPEKLEAGLRHFSSFAKLSYIFNFFEDFNCRIRETALIVAMDLWQFDELKADIQAMIMSSNEVCKTEHALVTRLLDTDERAMRHHDARV